VIALVGDLWLETVGGLEPTGWKLIWSPGATALLRSSAAKISRYCEKAPVSRYAFGS
jgi:hypothetical protein